MKCLFLCCALIMCITTTQARSVKPYKACDGVLVGNIDHEREVLKTIKDSPYQLAIDYDTNTIFFSYTVNEQNRDEIFKSAYLNLKTNEFNTIPGIAGGFANAVDKKSQTVYLGGRDGIYQFNFETKRAENLHITDLNIWQLSHSDNLYFTTYPTERLYKYKNGVVDIVPELQGTKVLLAAVDNNKNIVFSNSSGLFVYKKSDDTINLLGSYNLNGITNDINGNIFFSTPEGIYTVNQKLKVEHLASIPNVYGVAIESDGSIIYANNEAIIRLKPSKEKCYHEVEKYL